MLEPAGGETKIEAAKKVMAEVVPGLPPEARVGLIAYGHRRKGDCTDIEVLVPPGSTDRDALLEKVRALRPTGMTPITRAVLAAADLLKLKENETTIVLVSDGRETCAADPCGIVKRLRGTGIKFVLHVVGFGVTPEEARQLECIASAGGGKYFPAKDSAELLKALNSVGADIARKVEAAKSVPAPASTGLPKIVVKMPSGTEKGAAGLRIAKAGDGKVIKETDNLAAESIHPVPPGGYAIDLLFATPNYGDPTVTPLGTLDVVAGQTRVIELGGVGFNLAPGVLRSDAVANEVILADSATGRPVVTVRSKNNGYYNFVPKAVLPGVYDVRLQYGNFDGPTTVARNVTVVPGKITTVTLDAAVRVKEPASGDVTGWDLVPVPEKPAGEVAESERAPGQAAAEPILKARPPHGNRDNLWNGYFVPPGRYDLFLHIKGMAEPLQAGSGLEIQAGKTLEFDSGL